MTNVLIQLRTCCNRCQVRGIRQRRNFITEIGACDNSTGCSGQAYANRAGNAHQCYTHRSNRTPGGTCYNGDNCRNQERRHQHKCRADNLHAIINHHRNSTCGHPGANKRTNTGQNQNCRHTLSNLLTDFIHHLIPGNAHAESDNSSNRSH